MSIHHGVTKDTEKARREEMENLVRRVEGLERRVNELTLVNRRRRQAAEVLAAVEKVLGE
jgi:polyhydroxyalkanoate synthesis regulator phasin